jgi:hypothetical protein
MESMAQCLTKEMNDIRGKKFGGTHYAFKLSNCDEVWLKANDKADHNFQQRRPLQTNIQGIRDRRKNELKTRPPRTTW